MEITSLKEITDLGWTKVSRHEGVTNKWFAELITVLQKEGLLPLLYQRRKDISG